MIKSKSSKQTKLKNKMVESSNQIEIKLNIDYFVQNNNKFQSEIKLSKNVYQNLLKFTCQLFCLQEIGQRFPIISFDIKNILLDANSEDTIIFSMYLYEKIFKTNNQETRNGLIKISDSNKQMKQVNLIFFDKQMSSSDVQDITRYLKDKQLNLIKNSNLQACNFNLKVNQLQLNHSNEDLMFGQVGPMTQVTFRDASPFSYFIIEISQETFYFDNESIMIQRLIDFLKSIREYIREHSLQDANISFLFVSRLVKFKQRKTDFEQKDQFKNFFKFRGSNFNFDIKILSLASKLQGCINRWIKLLGFTNKSIEDLVHNPQLQTQDQWFFSKSSRSCFVEAVKVLCMSCDHIHRTTKVKGTVENIAYLCWNDGQLYCESEEVKELIRKICHLGISQDVIQLNNEPLQYTPIILNANHKKKAFKNLLYHYFKAENYILQNHFFPSPNNSHVMYSNPKMTKNRIRSQYQPDYCNPLPKFKNIKLFKNRSSSLRQSNDDPSTNNTFQDDQIFSKPEKDEEQSFFIKSDSSQSHTFDRKLSEDRDTFTNKIFRFNISSSELTKESKNIKKNKNTYSQVNKKIFAYDDNIKKKIYESSTAHSSNKIFGNFDDGKKQSKECFQFDRILTDCKFVEPIMEEKRDQEYNPFMKISLNDQQSTFFKMWDQLSPQKHLDIRGWFKHSKFNQNTYGRNTVTEDEFKVNLMRIQATVLSVSHPAMLPIFTTLMHKDITEKQELNEQSITTKNIDQLSNQLIKHRLLYDFQIQKDNYSELIKTKTQDDFECTIKTKRFKMINTQELHEITEEICDDQQMLNVKVYRRKEKFKTKQNVEIRFQLHNELEDKFNYVISDGILYKNEKYCNKYFDEVFFTWPLVGNPEKFIEKYLFNQPDFGLKELIQVINDDFEKSLSKQISLSQMMVNAYNIHSKEYKFVDQIQQESDLILKDKVNNQFTSYQQKNYINKQIKNFYSLFTELSEQAKNEDIHTILTQESKKQMFFMGKIFQELSKNYHIVNLNKEHKKLILKQTQNSKRRYSIHQISENQENDYIPYLSEGSHDSKVVLSVTAKQSIKESQVKNVFQLIMNESINQFSCQKLKIMWTTTNNATVLKFLEEFKEHARQYDFKLLHNEEKTEHEIIECKCKEGQNLRQIGIKTTLLPVEIQQHLNFRLNEKIVFERIKSQVAIDNYKQYELSNKIQGFYNLLGSDQIQFNNSILKIILKVNESNNQDAVRQRQIWINQIINLANELY